ncbi:hypothetical protein [Vulgatibacter incomptus]|uniref:DUF883 domain-containing protein n=1 Tax=Vulgatibacter incomptus TaxID=1391653 RepID=A0A0K1P8D6_9BACT|nr:hypothetical protein [Vulgatibacter incomptus]AKU89788.1 hypothetical protein AKJ08_0175 [Vulgatibacter incomptus]
MNQGPSGGSPIYGDGAGHDVQEKVQQFAQDASAQLEQARMLFEDVGERVNTFIRERPGAALLGAVALGYVVGKIASKAGR